MSYPLRGFAKTGPSARSGRGGEELNGSIDSLLMNLLKALNNPAVQGVFAVSDADQLERIKRESGGIHALSGKRKCWDYEEVMKVHDALSGVNAAINALGLVPQGF